MPDPVVSHPPVLTADACARLGRDVTDRGASAGLAAVGITGAESFPTTRRDLESRRRDGLHAGMQFTYRNPRRSTEPDRVLPGARALVVGAWGYRRRDDERRPVDRPAGTVARYARADYYGPLRSALGQIADLLVAEGWRARVVADDNALVDRAAAHRAGLGWFGRNTLLLLPGLGSWFVLGSVVTDAPLVPTSPAGPTDHAEGCGSCRRCMAACPTGALVADGVLDARRCLAWLVQAPGTFPVEFREALGDRIYGCDDCQQVCPVNRTADRRRPPGPPDAGTVGSVDLLDLLDATDAALLEAHGRWYIADRDPRHLRRNALVALGNIGDGADPATAAALARYAGGDDELLAEHARWAADRLARTDRGTAATGAAT
ncbi:MAG TPA: tRNA epoxyqueuosine(34) reductase QueG [Acidimicrobiales bacterium]